MTSIVNQPYSFTHSFTESLLSKIHACQGGPIVLTPQTAQRIVEEFVAQIMALPVRERDFMADQLDVFEYVGCLGSNRRGE